MPSAPQNRFCANGKSFETFSTETPPAAARSLKVRTLNAHTGVSTDGKMFSSTDLPLNCSLLTAPRSNTSSIMTMISTSSVSRGRCCARGLESAPTLHASTRRARPMTFILSFIGDDCNDTIIEGQRTKHSDRTIKSPAVSLRKKF